MRCNSILLFAAVVLAAVFISCDPKDTKTVIVETDTTIQESIVRSIDQKAQDYISVKLEADLSTLSEKEKQIIPLLMEAADMADLIYWKQSFGDRDVLLSKINDENTAKLVEINYGPWDRLDGLVPLVDGTPKRTLGGNYYPEDIKYLQFVDMKYEDKFSKYTLLRRMEDGSLYTLPYHEGYSEEVGIIVEKLKEAAQISENEAFSAYLLSKAEALSKDDYFNCDMLWLDKKDSKLDFLIGPCEDEDDRFLHTKTAYESFLVIRDEEWSNKVSEYFELLPELKNSIPVDDKYKKEECPKGSDIYVCDAIYCKGWGNAASKSLSINRPKDPKVIMQKGMRNIQFRNINKLKFEHVITPLADLMIDPEQKSHIKFEAFFLNNIFYEIAENIELKNTVNTKTTVKQALKSYYNTISVGCADIARMYLITQLFEKGKLGEADLMDNYVTYMADIFRSIRFGVSHPQGQANMIRYNHFKEAGAFTRNAETGTYSVDLEKTKKAIESLYKRFIIIQGDGDYNAAKELVEEKGSICTELSTDLKKIENASIPKDLVFQQGKEVLGL